MVRLLSAVVVAWYSLSLYLRLLQLPSAIFGDIMMLSRVFFLVLKPCQPLEHSSTSRSSWRLFCLRAMWPSLGHFHRYTLRLTTKSFAIAATVWRAHRE